LPVLVARPAFHAERCRWGRRISVEALHYAAAALDIPIDHRVLLYEVFDRLAMAGVGALYAAANIHFVEQGIFRHLQVQTAMRGRAAVRARASIRARRCRSCASEPPRRVLARKKTSTMGEDTAAFGLAAFEVVSTPVRSSRPTRRRARRPVLRSAAELRDASSSSRSAEWLAARRRVLCIATPMKDAEAYEPSAREVQTALARCRSAPRRRSCSAARSCIAPWLS
jgi:hypothetical protein